MSWMVRKFLSENVYGFNKTFYTQLGHTTDVIFQGLKDQRLSLEILLQDTVKVDPRDFRVRASDDAVPNAMKTMKKFQKLW